MDIREMKEEIKITIVEYLKELEVGITDCVEFLRQEKEKEGMELMIKIIDGLNWSIEAISLSLDSQSNPIENRNILEIISEMMSAMENNDNILLSDMLEYEILPLIREWSEKIQD